MTDMTMSTNMVIKRVSVICAATVDHSTELCDDHAATREWLGWRCECECHGPY